MPVSKNKSYVVYYFKPLHFDPSTKTKTYKCSCGNTSGVKRNAGFTNLIQTYKKEHPDEEEAARQNNSIVFFHRAKNLYSWIQLVIMEKRTFDIPEHELPGRIPKRFQLIHLVI